MESLTFQNLPSMQDSDYICALISRPEENRVLWYL